MQNESVFKNKHYKGLYTELMKHYFSSKEIEELVMWKDYWFDAKEMLKRWIATELI